MHFLKLTTSRASSLQCVIHGLQKLGVPLVCYHTSGYITAGGATDDIGLYWLAGPLGKWFHLNPHGAAVLLNICFSLTVLAIAAPAIFGLFRAKSMRFCVLFAILLLVGLVNLLSPVYASGAFMALAFVPWIFLLPKLLSLHWQQGYILMFMLFGVVLSLSAQVRSFASVPIVAGLIIAVFIFSHISWWRRVALWVGFLMGVAFVHAALFYTLHVRLVHLANNTSISRQQIIKLQRTSLEHPLWHNVFIGLGFYSDNPWGLRYIDSDGVKAARKIDPDVKYLSVQYGNILRHLYFQHLLQYPWYVAKITARKLNTCFWGHKMWPFTVVWLLGLLIVWRCCQWRSSHYALVVAAMLAILPGIIVKPSVDYVNPFSMIIGLYGLYQCCFWLESKLKRSE